MNFGGFSKMSIIYAFVALLLIIELGLTGYSKLPPPSSSPSAEPY